MAGGGGKGGGHKILVQAVWQKRSVQLFRGNARYEYVRFSEFHRPPAINNDHSLSIKLHDGFV